MRYFGPWSGARYINVWQMCCLIKGIFSQTFYLKKSIYSSKSSTFTHKDIMGKHIRNVLVFTKPVAPHRSLGRAFVLFYHLHLTPCARVAHKSPTLTLHWLFSCVVACTSFQDCHPAQHLSLSTVLFLAGLSFPRTPMYFHSGQHCAISVNFGEDIVNSSFRRTPSRESWRKFDYS